MTDNDIRRALDAAAPKEPGFDGWGDTVRKGHRRRRTAISAVAVLGLVALGVPVALQLSNAGNTPIAATPSPVVTSPTTSTASPTSTPSVRPEPSPAPSPVEETTGPLVSPTCVDSVGVVNKLPDGGLPAGATKVWLCDGNQEPTVPVYGPPEALTEGVAAAVAAFNALPETPGTACPKDDYAQAYTVVFEYPDREPLRLAGTTHACKVITDGTTNFSGADTYFDTLLALWEKQRSAASYVLVPDDSTVCLQAESFMGATISAAVRGFACGVPAGASSMHRDVIQRPLDPGLVERIVAAVKEEATVMPATELPKWSQSLVLVNRFGDPLTIRRINDLFFWKQGDKVYEWTPKAALLVEINTATTGMLTGQPPVDPATDEACDGMLVNAEGALSRATGATLCVYDASTGQNTAAELPEHLFRAVVDGLSASTHVVGADVSSDVTGSYIGLPAEAGRMFQVFIAKDGTLMWSRYDLSQVHWQPTAEVRAWLIDKGVPITS